MFKPYYQEENIKILNLYAGIGGNRKLWENVDVIAIEINPKIAKIYQDFFPKDKVIITDAHKYLLDHFKEFDFIWSSPPCPSHSKIRKYFTTIKKQNKPIFPDMKLYEEIIFLNNYFEGKYVVENVIGFYKPLIIPQEIQRHYFWSNFHISKIKMKNDNIMYGNIKHWEKFFNFNLDKYKNINKVLLLRNCVRPELGLHILNCAFPKNHKHIDNYHKQEMLDLNV